MTILNRIQALFSVTPKSSKEITPISQSEQAVQLIDRGNQLEENGQMNEALRLYEKAIEMAPALARAYLNKGNVLLQMEKIPDAVTMYRKAVELNPDYAAAHFNLGNAQIIQNSPDAALDSYEKAIQLKPDFVDAYVARGNVLGDMKRFQDAIDSYQQALKLAPAYAQVHGNLAATLKDAGDLISAMKHYQAAIETDADYLRAYGNLADVYRELGRIDDAVQICRTALRKQPDMVPTYTQLLFCLSHSNRLTAQQLFEEHKRFGDQFEAPFRAMWPVHDNVKDPQKTLRIGLVSADLRAHAVAFFLEPVLAALQHSQSLSLFVYYNHEAEDEITQRIKATIPRWQVIVGLNDHQVAQKILADKIDILIDLSGHTGKHRLLTFARKPAPIQVSWVGYPGTTGLQAMDYYLAGRHFLPAFELDDQFTEKIARLPVTVPFLPISDSPDVNALPALENGYITFGSFNRIDKIGREVVALWAQLLREIPTAKMLIAGLPANGEYEHLWFWFEQEGIPKTRLEFHNRSNMHTYLALHHKVDVCLDTFPYTGGTTTNHALWMGVPTLTLTGTTPAGRQSSANLSDVNLIQEFGAKNHADFVALGKQVASDLESLSSIRQTLRSRFLNAPFSKTDVFATNLEHMLRAIWQRWCQGLPPAAIEVTTNNQVIFPVPGDVGIYE